MDALEAIMQRRSIRKYTDEAVSEEHIQILLDAAMAAPSACNAAEWHFVVITDRAALDEIPEMNPYAAMARQAPLAILVCADKKAEIYPGFWVQDASAAMENLLVAATALGLGAVWTGIHPIAERSVAFAKRFKLPEGVMPLGLAVIGHPAQALAPHGKADPAKIHRNAW